MRVKLIVVSLLCLILGSVGSGGAAESKDQSVGTKHYKIVFSVFDDSSAGEYSYLRNSIQAMLASRLAARDRVTVLEKTFTQKELLDLKKQGTEKALTVGGKKADYLVTGNLFSLTTGLETQVDLYPLAAEKDILQFSVLSQTPDTLITDIEQLAGDIAHTAFGEGVTVGNAGGGVGTAGDAAFVTAHPEVAYKKNLYSGTLIGVAGSGVTTKGRGARLNTVVPGDIRVMAVGDVNGDGQKEIVTVSDRKLRLFKTTSKSIELLAETKLSSTLTSHAVNMADVDGDGREEIYLSATDGLYVSSIIMTYSHGGFQIVAAHIPWYLRPLTIPGEGMQLVGQRRGIEKTELVKPGIFLISLEGNQVIKGKRLPLPGSLNLFDFVYADIDGDGFSEVIAVDQKEKLRIYNPSNELMWVSKKNFGGSKIYLGPSQGEVSSESTTRNFTPDENAYRDFIFVPGRILVIDIDRDGKEEVIVSEIKQSGEDILTRVRAYLNRIRSYDGGAVVSLAWDGSKLVESWRTGHFRGYIAGYGFALSGQEQVADKTQDDSNIKTTGKLYISHLPTSGSLAALIPGKNKSELTVYDLDFAVNKKEDK